MTALAYQKGSPLLQRYIEMNRIKAVQVWPSSTGKGFDVMEMTGCLSTTGFNATTRNLYREAKADAQKLADHMGLPLLKKGR
jgi:hypothetical protein